jgi:hypothetical protein
MIEHEYHDESKTVDHNLFDIGRSLARRIAFSMSLVDSKALGQSSISPAVPFPGLSAICQTLAWD